MPTVGNTSPDNGSMDFIGSHSRREFRVRAECAQQCYDPLDTRTLMPELSRRELTFGTAAMFFPGTLRHLPGAEGVDTKTRIILLGTAGGPVPRRTRVPSSQVVLVNQHAYVFDCGIGVTTQLARAGVRLPSLRHVFITHHHSDHNAEYGPLLLTAWGAGLRTPVDTWGPPPLSE